LDGDRVHRDVLGGGQEHIGGADRDDRAELRRRVGERQQGEQGQHHRGLQPEQPGAVPPVPVEKGRPKELDRPDQADELQDRQGVQRRSAVAQDRAQADGDEADAEVLRDV
jgi:hypothetical protein